MKNWISEFWCRNMHTKAMWPIHGKYVCPQCLREHPVAWEAPFRNAGYDNVPMRKPEIPIATTVSVVQ